MKTQCDTWTETQAQAWAIKQPAQRRQALLDAIATGWAELRAAYLRWESANPGTSLTEFVSSAGAIMFRRPAYDAYAAQMDRIARRTQQRPASKCLPILEAFSAMRHGKTGWTRVAAPADDDACDIEQFYRRCRRQRLKEALTNLCYWLAHPDTGSTALTNERHTLYVGGVNVRNAKIALAREAVAAARARLAAEDVAANAA